MKGAPRGRVVDNRESNQIMTITDCAGDTEKNRNTRVSTNINEHMKQNKSGRASSPRRCLEVFLYKRLINFTLKKGCRHHINQMTKLTALVYSIATFLWQLCQKSIY